MGEASSRHAAGAVLALAATLLVAAVAAAHPPRPVDKQGRPIRGVYHRWLHQAKVPLPPGRIQIVLSGCPGYPRFVGCVFTRRPGRIFVKPNARSPRTVLYHELGHVFDLRVMNARERRAFKRIMRLGNRRWYAGGAPPAELFAEAYAACARYGPRRRALGRSVWGFRPSLRQHRAACRLIVNAAKPRGRKPQRPRKPPRVVVDPPRESPPPPPPGSGPPPERCGDSIFDLLEPECRVPGSRRIG